MENKNSKLILMVVMGAILIALSMNGCANKGSVTVVTGPQGEQGVAGPTGPTGANGHSLSSLVTTIADGVVCPNGGTSLDVYLDLDDSLSYTEGDLYLNSIYACNGLNGLNGINGLDGTNGADGAIGATGAQGPQGVTGQPGPQGPQGVPGPQGATGATGATGSTGATGATGVQGPAGPAGSPGAPGAQGPQGPAGTNGTVTPYNSSSCTAIAGTSYYYAKDGGNAGIYTTSSCSNSHKASDLGNSDSFWVSATALAVSDDNAGIRVINF